jgi:hypothetical protein
MHESLEARRYGCVASFASRPLRLGASQRALEFDSPRPHQGGEGTRQKATLRVQTRDGHPKSQLSRQQWNASTLLLLQSDQRPSVNHC